jgi:hypothetical protein
MARYATIGNVTVTDSTPTCPEVGDQYYDEEREALFIYYGDGVGWLQVDDVLEITIT